MSHVQFYAHRNHTYFGGSLLKQERIKIHPSVHLDNSIMESFDETKEDENIFSGEIDFILN